MTGCPVKTVEADPDSKKSKPPKFSSASSLESLNNIESLSIIKTVASDTLDDQTTKKMLSIRRKIMNEIVDTEIRYVADLLFLKRNYSDPLLELVDTKDEIIPKKLIQDIFSNHESILAINQELRNQLQDRIRLWDSGYDQVGDIFLSLTPFLRIYSLFLTNFNSSINLVADLIKNCPNFACFVKERNKHPESHNLVLQAFLVTPVQRIPRYKLLLEDLFKNTPSDHPDYEQLKESIKLIADVANNVNETIRVHENMLQMLSIQRNLLGFGDNVLVPGRRFIKSGKVQKISRRNHQSRHLFLFSDILIYAAPSLIDDHFHFHRKIDLNYLRLEDSRSESSSQQFQFQIFSREKSFAVYTDSQKVKDEWILAIQNTVDECRRSAGTLQTGKTEQSQRFDAPVWMPDEFSSKCLICAADFSMIKRKHHCRSCGIVVCHGCSRNTFFAPHQDGERQVRVCDTCFPSLVQERKFRVGVPSTWGILDFDDGTSINSSRRNSEASSASDTSRRSSGIILDNDPRRDSIISHRSSINSISSLFSRRGLVKSTLDTGSIYTIVVGEPKKINSNCCTLCSDSFSINKWKNQCPCCNRLVCKSCLGRDPEKSKCDPCYLLIEPMNVIVNPEGSEWSFRPSY